MAKKKYIPTLKSKASPRQFPIFKDGKQVGLVGVGGSISIKAIPPNKSKVIKEATPTQYAEIYLRLKGDTELIEELADNSKTSKE